MDRFANLDRVLSRVWDRLTRAAEDPGHAYRTLTFGTVCRGAPRLRTVILRSAERNERALAFHTDRRSPKVVDVRRAERIAWRGWDPEMREQVRLRGSGRVHTDDALADSFWEAENARSLAIYLKGAAPGTSLDDPDSGLSESARTEVQHRADVAPGRPHFAVVRTVIDEIDWLHLHPDGHYRAQFGYEPDQQSFEGTWVVP